MLNPLFIDAVAARLMRVGHYTNVDAVKDAMADVAKAMDADLPSNVVAELRVALAKSQKDCIERGQIVIATQEALVKAHEDNMLLTDELADAKKTSTQTGDVLTNLSEEKTDAASSATAGAGSTSQEPAQDEGWKPIDGLTETQTAGLAQPENN